MLTARHHPPLPRMAGRRQSGVVLIIALIVMVAMTLAALSMMRSVDTNNLIAGNLAFQRAATLSSDTGVEAAITWLETNNSGVTLDNDDATNGYSANGSNAAQAPAVGQTWDEYWMQSLTTRAYQFNGGAADSAGNVISYVIDRLCNNSGGKTTGAACVASPVVQTATGNGEEAGEPQLSAASVVYYRITVRVAGPKNTVSYVQTVVSL
jgi:type IV pilus assembly protein PilX